MEQTTQELNPFLSLQVERKPKAKKKPYIKPAAVKRLEERLHEARLKRYSHLDIPPSYIVKEMRRASHTTPFYSPSGEGLFSYN